MTMAKTNTQKQRKYRERKKLNDSKFLEKDRKRQKGYYVKTSNLSKKGLKERRIEVKGSPFTGLEENSLGKATQ